MGYDEGEAEVYGVDPASGCQTRPGALADAASLHKQLLSRTAAEQARASDRPKAHEIVPVLTVLPCASAAEAQDGRYSFSHAEARQEGALA